MHGFGSVPDDDAQFHADWERTVFALDKIVRAHGLNNIDEKRHSIELMEPAKYLTASYFERWLAAIETILVEKEVLSESDLEQAHREAASADSLEEFVPERYDEEIARLVREAWATPASYDRPGDEPAFAVDDPVRVRNIHPEGHTRCPQYVRRTTGEVHSVHGSHVLPDANAHGEERAEPLYTVAFSAGDVWGSDAEEPGDTVHVDLWEPYLEAVHEG